MAYIPRLEVPDGYYHVVSRGNNKRTIFIDDVDRRLFLVMLRRVARRYGWLLYAYCLMGNHYHLVLQIGERGLSRGMCELNGGYAIAFNGRHGRINHLFGKRFWSELILDDAYLLASCRYALLNPCRAGLVDDPSAWTWSSYRATIGLALALPCLAADALLALFAPNRAAAVERFERFCADGLSGHGRRQPP